MIEPELQTTYDEKIKLEERLPSLKKEFDRIRKEKDTVLSDIEEKENRISSILKTVTGKNEELSADVQKKKELEEKIDVLEKEKEEISKPLKQDELERIEGELESLRTHRGDTDSCHRRVRRK